MAKQLHVVASSNIDTDDDETSVDNRQIKKYKKAAQKYYSKNGKRSH